MAACLLFPASSVYGHGLGIDTISSIDIQGKEISITVEMPMYFEGDQEQITITATEDETKENAKNVTFLIGLFHNNEMIFRKYFFAEDGILPIKIIPTQEGKVTIHGEQDSFLGAWHGTESNPIKITGPIFTSGGLYNFEIEVRTIDDPTNIIEDSGVYNANLSIIETTEFFQKDAKDTDVKFQTKSYFDKISNFEYDPEAKQVTFEIPFDWSEKQISHIPVVHEEVHFPKDFDEFMLAGYKGKVNGIDLFKASVTIDDYTEEDERIVHFILLQDHLRYIKNQLEKSDEPLPDKMTFTLSTSKDIEIPVEDVESTAVLDFPPTSGSSSDQDVSALKSAVSSLQKDVSEIKSGSQVEDSSEGAAYDFAILGLSIAAAAIILAVIALVKRK